MTVEISNEQKERMKKRKIDILTERYFEAQMDKVAYEAIGDTEKAEIEQKKIEEYEKAIAAIREL